MAGLLFSTTSNLKITEREKNKVQIGIRWYLLIMPRRHMHNLSAAGGNDKTTFYVGLGYQYQESFFKSNDLNYTKYNVRSNITSKITDRLTFDLNLNGVDR